ncbi:MAG: type 4a pilus biogenesis protein PilO [Candidatus Omnitrophota bacterium]
MNLANIQLDKQKKILIVIFCVLIAYVDLNYILKAQVAGVNSLGPKINRLEKDLVNLNRNLESMRSAKNKDGLALQKTARRSSKIIPENQISGLLQDIAKEANKFEIIISQIRPSYEVKTQKPGEAGGKFIPYLINLDLTCDYHNLGKFINALENFPVFIGVQELKISTQLPDYMKQKVNLVLKTYVTK